MHVAQIDFLPAPAACTATGVLAQWPSLVDIAEAAGRSGVRVSVIQAATYTERLTRNGIDYHFVDVDAAGADGVTGRGRRFASVLQRCGADLLHVHGLGFAEDAFAVSQCLPRLPVLFQDHAGQAPRWWRRSPWRRWWASAAGFAFTAAEQARPFVASRLFGPQARVFAIPESSSRFHPGHRARARALTGLHGDPCVLWVGHLSPNKDPLTVLDGVARAMPRLGGLHLWCAFGRAPLLDVVRRRIARDARLGGRVHLLGPVTHARIEALLQAADLFVSGSHAEGSGYALLEALACGVPPIVTDIPPFRALAGDVGLRWPCGDAARLADALADPAARTPPAQVRAHFDAHLSLAALGRQWAAAYAQVLDDRLRRAA